MAANVFFGEPLEVAALLVRCRSCEAVVTDIAGVNSDDVVELFAPCEDCTRDRRSGDERRETDRTEAPRRTNERRRKGDR